MHLLEGKGTRQRPNVGRQLDYEEIKAAKGMMTPCEEFLAKKPRNVGQWDHEEIKAGTSDVEFSRRVSGKEIKNYKGDQ